jgi:hypothetical protein
MLNEGGREGEGEDEIIPGHVCRDVGRKGGREGKREFVSPKATLEVCLLLRRN